MSLSWVFDTNVIVSAHLNAMGHSARLVAQITAGRLRMTYDSRIALEYQEVLARARFMIPLESRKSFQALLQIQDLVVSASKHKMQLPDADDIMFLEAAQHATNKVLVTGNMKHYPAPQRHGIRVLSPKEAWEYFCKQDNPPILR